MNLEESCPKESCPICLKNISSTGSNYTKTKCNHAFCFDCLLNHLYEKVDCPLCRRNISNKTIKKKITRKQSHSIIEGIIMNTNIRFTIEDKFPIRKYQYIEIILDIVKSIVKSIIYEFISQVVENEYESESDDSDLDDII